jgi:tetratricopeptide (TPR) repeat protein
MWGIAAAVILVLGWQGWPSLRSAGRPLPPGMFRFSRGGSWEGPYERGSYLYRIGEFRQAEKEFRRSLELLPANPEALNMLAYALAEQKRVEEALKVALKALDRAPNRWMIIDTVAEMHQRSGAFAAAAAYYRRALRYPEARQVSETACKYGETLLALGNRAEAIRQFQIAADNFEPPWAERARAHLQRLGVQSPFPTRARGMQAAPLQAPAVQ